MPYVHVVFTLPHTLHVLCRRNVALVYHLLFRASADTLLEVAATRRHLGARIGFLSILHTWGQTLRPPSSRPLRRAGRRASPQTTSAGSHPTYAGFFLPVNVLSRVFRGKFVEGLRRAHTRGELDLTGASAGLCDPVRWHAFVDALFRTDWVVYAKLAFGGPAAVLRYLGRYTHRVAISNQRLVAFDGEHITFRWKDYTHDGEWRTMTLTAMEFLRRFVQHVLPRGFVRIRQYGYLASACRTARLARARRLLRRTPPPPISHRRRPLPLGTAHSVVPPMILGAILSARASSTAVVPRLRHIMIARDTARDQAQRTHVRRALRTSQTGRVSRHRSPLARSSRSSSGPARTHADLACTQRDRCFSGRAWPRVTTSIRETGL